MGPTANETWQDAAQRTTRARDAKLYGGRFSSLRPDTSADATELLSKIHSGAWTAEEVTLAFCKRAIVAHQYVNCIMDDDMEAAVERAHELDRRFTSTGGDLVGPLHGLPVSIKARMSFRRHHTQDLTAVKGLHYTMGYVSWADSVSDEDAVIVESLRNAGAVIFVETTMPQSGMAVETVSKLWGRTLNPFNVHLVAGGSSGGEGALIACRGSLMGMGTDSGGSIRIPAPFNGSYSLKPTPRRISYKGNNNNASGLGVSSSIGPMAHSVRDLTLVAKVLIDDASWMKDPFVVQKPWSPPSDLSTPLRIGVMAWDGYTMPHPPIQRALATAKEKLHAAGHDVVPLAPHDLHRKGHILSGRTFGQIGSGFIEYALNASGEPPIKAIEKTLNFKPLSLEGVVQVQKDWRAFREEYLTFWRETALLTRDHAPIDALLMPTFASVSFPHDFVPALNYTAIYNLLENPTVTLPVTKADQSIDFGQSNYKPINEDDENNHRMYDPELFHGMPVALQLVGLPYAEEHLLGVADIVDKIMHDGRY